jgi:hypothetical protein
MNRPHVSHLMLVLALFGCRLSGQSSDAVINGIVTDSAGRLCPMRT